MFVYKSSLGIQRRQIFLWHFLQFSNLNASIFFTLHFYITSIFTLQNSSSPNFCLRGKNMPIFLLKWDQAWEEFSERKNISHEVLGTNFNIFYFRKWLLSYCSPCTVLLPSKSMAHTTSVYKPWFCITKLEFLFH